MQLNSALKLIKPKYPIFLDIVKSQYNWDLPNDEICLLLEDIYGNKNIEFELSDVKNIDHKYVKSGGCCGDFITLELSRTANIAKFLKRIDNRRNKEKIFEIDKFLRELIVVLSHEMKHQEQNKTGRFGNYENENIYSLSDPSEIEAYAFDAAVEINLRGRSTSWMLYKTSFGPRHPTMKKFKELYNEFRNNL